MKKDILEYILRNQLANGAFPEQEGKDADILTTAWIVSSLFEIKLQNVLRDYLRKALVYLYSSQDESGKWGEGGTKWDTGITAAVIHAFITSGLDLTSKSMLKGWTWLIDKQRESGAFISNTTTYQPNSYCTAYALRTMHLYPDSCQGQQKKALDWLTDTQNKDGGFSLYGKGESKVSLTAHVVHSLYQYTNYFRGNVGLKAVHYLIDNQASDGSWYAWHENAPSIGATSLALFSLKKSDIIGPIIGKGFDFLEKQLKLGNWEDYPLRHLINVVVAMEYR